MTKKLSLALVLSCVIAGTGCAQMMAACKPGPVNREVLQRGAFRSDVVAALGHGRGRLRQGAVTRTEHYTYTDGGKKNATGAKAGRIVLYTAGDLFTLFLSQILWMPMETLITGTQYRADVDYRLYTDGTWRVQDFAEAPRPSQPPADVFCDT